MRKGVNNKIVVLTFPFSIYYLGLTLFHLTSHNSVATLFYYVHKTSAFLIIQLLAEHIVQGYYIQKRIIGDYILYCILGLFIVSEAYWSLFCRF